MENLLDKTVDIFLLNFCTIYFQINLINNNNFFL